MAASTTVAKAKTTAAQQTVTDVQVPGISRREFLYYAWSGSMAVLLAETSGLLIWFALPRFRVGEFGGTFTLKSVPFPDMVPEDHPEGKFWLSNTDQGIVALYKVCTHLGCLYKWVDVNHRFECPCHGSKFELDGKYIEGPAPRSLDRFEMAIVTTNGTFTTNAVGDPIQVDASSVSEIRIDTSRRIKRAGRI